MKKVVILGAAGRDFHNFNTVYRDNPQFKVVAFTATQIPDIAGRVYPRELAGKLYPKGIPILPETDLEKILEKEKPDQVVFGYSDVTHEQVMHLASVANAHGAEFVLLPASATQIKAKVPVIAICAVRTGVGKSQTSRYISNLLKAMGKRVVSIRHPMPYGNLAEQAVQRFATLADLKKHKCTIEEMEEYEPHIANGFVVYAGVDYGAILQQAQKEADVILWDGGNNDLSFYKPDLLITLVDPHRAGHEMKYHPGETNLRMADVVIVNKVETAKKADIALVKENIKAVNPNAIVLDCKSPFIVSDKKAIKGKTVVVVEDGPTLTHGGMTYGAGYLAAVKAGAKKIVSPVPYAVRSIAATYKKYPHCKDILPAMGYGAAQIRDLKETVAKVPADLIVIGTPIDLRRVISFDKPAVRVRYELAEVVPGKLKQIIKKVVK